MRNSVKVSLGAMVAAAGLVAALVVPSAATTTSPKMVVGAGSCTTDASGVCAITHNLGVTPDSVVVSPATPGSFNSFMLNVVGGSFTATTFKVRAMFSPTAAKKNGTIWVSYVASVGEQGTPPPVTSPPVTPPSSSTTVPPPPSTSGTPPPVACAKPTTFPEQDGGDFPIPTGEGDKTATNGTYYVHNNAWNWQGSSQHETLYACTAANWWVDDYNFAPNNGEVYMYPNSHLDVNGGNGKPLSTWNTITGRFAGKGPGAGSYDVAWDLWLNGLADKNSFEMMVWTEYHGNADPAGTKRGTYTDASTGEVYDVWWDGTHTDQAYLAYVSQKPQLSGTVDLRGMIVNAQQKGYLPAGDTGVNQIDYGNEVRDTQGATAANPYRFSLTDFGVTMK